MKSLSLFLILLTLATSACSTAKKVNTDNKEIINDEAKLPPLTNAVVKKVWVKPKIQGTEYHDGHWMYVIDKQVQWRD